MERRPDIYGILGAFSMKKLAAEDVMRGMMEHDGWLAPAVALPANAEGHVVADRIVMYGEETRLPPGELWLFTEERYAEAAHRQGALLGACAAGLRGVDVFASTPEGLQILKVNPGSPAEEGFFLGSPGAIELGRVWAQAVVLERLISAPGALERPDVRARLRACQELLAIGVGRGLATTSDARGKWLILFTAPDYAEAYLRALRGQGGDGRLQPAAGDKLFAVIDQMGLAGVRVNPAIEGSEVSIDAPACAQIAAT